MIRWRFDFHVSLTILWVYIKSWQWKLMGQCSWHSICIQKFFSFVHCVVKCWKAAAICFYERCTIGVNNNVDYYYSEYLQLQLIWLAAVGIFSSHNGSRIDSKKYYFEWALSILFLIFYFHSKTRSRSSKEKSLYD